MVVLGMYTSPPSPCTGPIIHHRAVLLRENYILVVGGRRSPFSPNNVLYTLNVMGDCGEWKIMECDGEMKPRWRHSAARYKLHGMQKYYISM